MRMTNAPAMVMVSGCIRVLRLGRSGGMRLHVVLLRRVWMLVTMRPLMSMFRPMGSATMVVACRVRMRRGVVSRPRRSLCPQHPESDPHDQETGQQCDIGFDRLRHESGQTKRGQHCDQDNTTGMRQRHKDAQNNRINGPPSNPDKVCRRNGLAVTRCCGVHRAEPEAGYQVKPDLAHDGVYWAKESCSAGAQTPAGTRHCMCCMPAAWRV